MGCSDSKHVQHTNKSPGKQEHADDTPTIEDLDNADSDGKHGEVADNTIKEAEEDSQEHPAED